MSVRAVFRFCSPTVVQESDDDALSSQFMSTRKARADQIDSHRSAVQLDGRLVRAARVELELFALVAGPAIMPLSWAFSTRWFASFAGADRRLTEQEGTEQTALPARSP